MIAVSSEVSMTFETNNFLPFGMKGENGAGSSLANADAFIGLCGSFKSSFKFFRSSVGYRISNMKIQRITYLFPPKPVSGIKNLPSKTALLERPKTGTLAPSGL